MIIARESAAGLDSTTDLADILSNALPSIGSECLRSPVKKVEGDKNSSSVSNYKIFKHTLIFERCVMFLEWKWRSFRMCFKYWLS